MPSLPEFQEAFAAAVAGGLAEAFLPFVVADRVPAAKRLAVYRNNATHNFREALRAVYPVVDRIVGERFFDHTSDAYARQHPSTSGDIHDFGDRFGDFLAAFSPAAGLPYLPDVARLEWAIHQVFHAAAPLPFPLDRLAAVPERDHVALRFVLAPTCHLLASDWPVQRLWSLNQPGTDWDEDFDVGSGGVALLVRRNGFEVEMEAQEPMEFDMLRRLAEGERLGDALQAVRQAVPDFDLGAFLQRHLLSATFADFTAGDRD